MDGSASDFIFKNKYVSLRNSIDSAWKDLHCKLALRLNSAKRIKKQKGLISIPNKEYIISDESFILFFPSIEFYIGFA